MELKIINEKIGQLRVAEGQTKSLIAELIVAVTERIHEHNEVDSANAFMLALTPLNQKKVRSFFKAHAGHKMEEGILAKRHKAYVKDGVKVDPYQHAHDAFDAFKQSGMNFWQWAVQAKAKEEKAITLEDVAKRATKAREAMIEGIQAGVVDKVQAFEMLTGGVLTFEDIQQVLAAMLKAEEAVTQAAVGMVGNNGLAAEPALL
jgi:hypothetical protein